jgi:glycosyltransferase involved in cell wall biosynthesis
MVKTRPPEVRFHATDEHERMDIIRQFGEKVVIHTIPNFSGSQDQLSLPVDKRKGFLQVLFIGRIHPIKGLDVLLNALRQTKQNILLTIAGNIEIVSFWNVCKKIIGELPGNVQVKFENHVPHNIINQLIRRHHIFCLPTQGENFGHAIFEALAAGRPVLISDQTPWRNLTWHKAGWDIPLNKPERFSEQIERCALMEAGELNEWCNGAWQYCKKYIESTDIKQQYLKLFS